MAKTEKYFLGPRLLEDIRRVVGRVESQPHRPGAYRVPTVHESLPSPGGGSGIKICTFSGSWPIGAYKVVTEIGSSQKTHTAVNLFSDITNCGVRPCAVTRYGTVTYVIAAACQ